MRRDRDSGFVGVGRESDRFFRSDRGRHNAATLPAIRKVLLDKRPLGGSEFAVQINGQKFSVGTLARKPLYILHAFYRLHNI